MAIVQLTMDDAGWRPGEGVSVVDGPVAGGEVVDGSAVADDGEVVDGSAVAEGSAAGDDGAVAGDGEPSGGDGSFSVEVTRSGRRRRTVQARLVGHRLLLSIPATMSRAEEAHWVREMSRRFERRRSTNRIDLTERADTLAFRLGLLRPASIRWVDNQTTRWGSCTPVDSTIRISSRVATFPRWVVDYVIVHELAHLSVAAHDAAFWSLVNRYGRAERARGYLIAKGGEDDA